MIQLVTETVTSRIFSAFSVGGNTAGCIYNDIPDSTFQCLLDSSSCQARDIFWVSSKTAQILNWKLELEPDAKVTITWRRGGWKALSFLRLVRFRLCGSVLLVLGVWDRNRSDYLEDYKPLMCLSRLKFLASFFFSFFFPSSIEELHRSQMHLSIIHIWEERGGKWLLHYWLKKRQSKSRVRVECKPCSQLPPVVLPLPVSQPRMPVSSLQDPCCYWGTLCGAVVTIPLLVCISWPAVLYFAALVWAFVSSLIPSLPWPQLLLFPWWAVNIVSPLDSSPFSAACAKAESYLLKDENSFLGRTPLSPQDWEALSWSWIMACLFSPQMMAMLTLQMCVL